MPSVSTEEAANKSLALYTPARSGDTYVLYDAGLLKKIYEEQRGIHSDDEVEVSESTMDRFEEVVYATIQVDRSMGKKRQYGVPSVAQAAARKGYGPLMYDIVMSIEGGLVPDRNTVSDKAASVWSTYYDMRSDVGAKLLDDIDPGMGRTKTKFDDSIVYPGDEDDPYGEENPLNYAYFATSSPNFDALIQNHEAMKTWCKKRNIDLADMGDAYFRKKTFQS